jgi:hypothetical protein
MRTTDPGAPGGSDLRLECRSHLARLSHVFRYG